MAAFPNKGVEKGGRLPSADTLFHSFTTHNKIFSCYLSSFKSWNFGLERGRGESHLWVDAERFSSRRRSKRR
jgi:hypothetical protein